MTKSKTVPQKVDIKFPIQLDTPADISLLHEYFKEKDYKITVYDEKTRKNKFNSSVDSELLEFILFAALPNAKAYEEHNKFVLSCETPEIILKEVNFGKFKLMFTYTPYKNYYSDKDFLCEVSLRLEALTPNVPKGENGIYHPNVMVDNICLGQGSDIVYNNLRLFSFVEAYDVIVNVLNTISYEPYLSLSAWTGEKCTNCDADNTVQMECKKCAKELCDDCSDTCPVCFGRTNDLSYYHSSCMKTVKCCRYKVCSNCIIKSRYNYGKCCWELCLKCTRPKAKREVCKKCVKVPKKKVVQPKPSCIIKSVKIPIPNDHFVDIGGNDDFNK